MRSPNASTFKLSLGLTILIILGLCPALFALKIYPINSRPLPAEDLNLIFAILACAAIPLAAMTVNSWPTGNKKVTPRGPFSKRYKILTPVKILADRKKQKKGPAQRMRRAPNPAATATPSISMAQWATLPLFQQTPDSPTESLLDLADNPLLMIDNEGNILAANHSAEEILELTQENSKLIKITDIIPRLFPDPDEESEPLQKFAFQNNQTEVVGIARETQAITTKGRKIQVQLRMSKQEVHNALVIVIEIIPQN